MSIDATDPTGPADASTADAADTGPAADTGSTEAVADASVAADTGSTEGAGDASDTAPEVVVVPVKKFEVNITLDDLLTKMSEQADSMAAPDSGEGLEPDVAERLQRLSQLAGQLKAELSQVDSTVVSRLTLRRPAAG